MFRKGQLVRDVLNNQLAIVLFVYPRRRWATIIYLHTLKVCKKDIEELMPYDPDDGSGGSPVIVFTNEEINELSKLIEVNGGTLGQGEIVYHRNEQLVVLNKLMRLRRLLTQNEMEAYC